MRCEEDYERYKTGVASLSKINNYLKLKTNKYMTTIKITEAKVREMCRFKLNSRQLKQILLKVEHDPVLWREIKNSIEDAIEAVAF